MTTPRRRDAAPVPGELGPERLAGLLSVAALIGLGILVLAANTGPGGVNPATTASQVPPSQALVTIAPSPAASATGSAPAPPSASARPTPIPSPADGEGTVLVVFDDRLLADTADLAELLEDRAGPRALQVAVREVSADLQSADQILDQISHPALAASVAEHRELFTEIREVVADVLQNSVSNAAGYTAGARQITNGLGPLVRLRQDLARVLGQDPGSPGPGGASPAAP